MGILNKFFGQNPEDEEQDELALGNSDALEIEDDTLGELALDVYQDKDNVFVKSTVAGVKPEDLDITISDNVVTIKGERRREDHVSDENYLAQECYWGSFYRSFELPVEVDVDKAQADIENGVLTLILPKASRSRTKKVRIGG